MIAITWNEKEKEIEKLWKGINEYMELLKFQASCTIIAKEEKEMIGPPIPRPGGACGAKSENLSVSYRFELPYGYSDNR